MFPLPGAPRQQPMDPSRLKAFMDQPAGTASNAALKPSNARQSKRLFVYDLPPSVTEDGLVEFFNLQLNGLNVTHGVDPCISAQIAKNREFALLEFKSATDATVVLAMDGIHMEAPDMMQNGSSNGAGKGLTIRRPKDYIVPSVDETEIQEGTVSSEVPDTANKVCISNIPLYLTEEQVTELLSSFGALKAFVLVQDRGTGESRGFAFCEYVDVANTAIAVEGLNGMELGDKILKVGLASIGSTQASGLEMGVNAMSMFAGTTSSDLEEGRVLQLLNMVTAEELIDNDDYEGKKNQTEPSPTPTYKTLQPPKQVQSVVEKLMDARVRNLRRCPRRMPKVWRSPRAQGSTTVRRQQAIRRSGQDLCQIRQPGIGTQGSEIVGRKEIRRPNSGYYLFLRGKFVS